MPAINQLNPGRVIPARAKAGGGFEADYTAPVDPPGSDNWPFGKMIKYVAPKNWSWGGEGTRRQA